MTISLDLEGKSSFKLRILQGPMFDQDRERLSQVYGKKPIWENGQFKHWEVQRKALRQLLCLFKPAEIITLSQDCKQVLTEFGLLQTPIDSLDKETEEIVWVASPLYKEQEDYIRISKSKTKLICASEPGMGKTWCGLNRAKFLGFKKMIVCVPKCLLPNWKCEARRFLDLPSIVYHGTKQKRAKLQAELDNYPIIITTYTMIQELTHLKPDHLILDEAQVLCHHDTQIYKATQKFVKKHSDVCIQMLTGTPILHKPRDLWGLVNLLSTELAGDYKNWFERYEHCVQSITKTIVIRDKFGHPIFNEKGDPLTKDLIIPIKYELRNLDELHERGKSLIYRAKRDGIVPFTERCELITVEMSVRHKKLYNKIGKNILLELESGSITIPNAIAAFTKLIQASEGAFHIEPTWKDSAKLDYIEDRIKEQKVPAVIWTSYRETIEQIKERLGEDELVVYHGGLTDNQKKLAVWSFQGVRTDEEADEFEKIGKNWRFKPGEARIFAGVVNRLSSLGFNLHKAAHTYFPSWNMNGNVNTQAEDRMKRLDSEHKEVLTEYVLSDGTIDQDNLIMIFENLKACSHVLDGKGNINYSHIQSQIKKLHRLVG